MELNDLTNIVSFTRKFEEVIRQVWRRDEDRRENDAEHSFQLAMVGWMLIQKEKLDLDTDMVIKYALVHDLVEVYAGDVSVFDTENRNDKQEREQEALERIREEFAYAEEVIELIEGYESKRDRESAFIYALDKLLPMVNIYLDEGYSWKKNGIGLEQVLEYKKDKVSLDPVVNEFFLMISERITEDRDRFFN